MAYSLVVFIVLAVFSIALDVIAWKTRVGLLFLASGMIGVFNTANVYNSGNASTALTWPCDQSVACVAAFGTADANAIAALSAVLTIASFLLIMMLRDQATGVSLT